MVAYYARAQANQGRGEMTQKSNGEERAKQGLKQKNMSTDQNEQSEKSWDELRNGFLAAMESKNWIELKSLLSLARDRLHKEGCEADAYSLARLLQTEKRYEIILWIAEIAHKKRQVGLARWALDGILCKGAFLDWTLADSAIVDAFDLLLKIETEKQECAVDVLATRIIETYRERRDGGRTEARLVAIARKYQIFP